MMGRRSLSWLAAGAVLVVAGFLCAGSLASGTPGGDLTFLDCVGALSHPTPGCGASANVGDAFGIAVSPDNGDVYVASQGDRAVEVLARGADGKLTPSGCLGETVNGPGNCTRVSNLGTENLAISPDGHNVYVVGLSTLSILTRDAEGRIAAMNCIESFTIIRAPGVPHCPNTANLAGADAVAVSPDGNTVYVGSASSQAIEVFNRGAGGALTAAGCLGDADKGPGNCVKTAGLGQVASLAVSPDGKNVYAGSDNALSILDRQSNGAITPDTCIRNVATGPVGCPTQANLAFVPSIALSSDGKSLYATSEDNDAVEAFARGAGGGLTEVGCLGNTGSGPKNCTGISSFKEPFGVAVAGSGATQTVYVSAQGTLHALSVGADGSLGDSGCVVSNANSGSANCATATGLSDSGLVAVSPGGGNVYVSAVVPGSVLEFKRTPTAATTSTTTTTTTTTTKTTTTTSKPKPTPAKPAIAAQILFATVLTSKQGKRTLAVRLHVGKPVKASTQLLGARGALLASQATTLTKGSHTVSIPLPASVTPGVRHVKITLTDTAKHTRTLTQGVVIQH